MPNTTTISDEASVLLEIHLDELGITFQKEFQFYAARKWRFDYLLDWPNPRVAIEIEGGVFSQGRHTRGVGFTNDLDKYRMATILGYKVLRFTTGEVLNGTARAFIMGHLLGNERGI